MAIVGKYELVKNEGLKEFILALNLDANFAEKAEAATSTLEVSQQGEKVIIKTIYPHKEETITLVTGQEFDDTLPNGDKLKSVPTISGNSITVKSKKDGAEAGARTYDFSDSGVIVTITATSTPKVAKRHYKRV